MSNGPPRPSKTAFAVARAYIRVEENPAWREIAPKASVEQTKRVMESVVAGMSSTERLLQTSAFRALAKVLDRHGPMKGGVLHLALRKRWFEDQVRQAIADGFTQIVVLGAGYDVLAWRVARAFPAVKCFEVDTKATQREKYKGLIGLSKQHGLHDLPANLDLFVLDLSQGSADRALLAQKGADSSRPTLFVAEGVLMYLSEADAMQVFRAVREIRTPRSRFVFSFLGATPDGAIHAGSWDRSMRAMVKLAGEPFRFAIGPEGLESFLAAQGLALRDRADSGTLVTKYMNGETPSSPLLDWEFLAVAERSTSPGS